MPRQAAPAQLNMLTPAPVPALRNRYLTPAAHRLLGLLLGMEAEAHRTTGRGRHRRRISDYEPEITHAVPGGWWLDTEKLHAATCWRLIRLCAISQVYGHTEDGYCVFRLNREGRSLYNDANYVPQVAEATLQRIMQATQAQPGEEDNTPPLRYKRRKVSNRP